MSCFFSEERSKIPVRWNVRCGSYFVHAPKNQLIFMCGWKKSGVLKFITDEFVSRSRELWLHLFPRSQEWQYWVMIIFGNNKKGGLQYVLIALLYAASSVITQSSWAQALANARIHINQWVIFLVLNQNIRIAAVHLLAFILASLEYGFQISAQDVLYGMTETWDIYHGIWSRYLVFNQNTQLAPAP